MNIKFAQYRANALFFIEIFFPYIPYKYFKIFTFKLFLTHSSKKYIFLKNFIFPTINTENISIEFKNFGFQKFWIPIRQDLKNINPSKKIFIFYVVVIISVKVLIITALK